MLCDGRGNLFGNDQHLDKNICHLFVLMLKIQDNVPLEDRDKKLLANCYFSKQVQSQLSQQLLKVEKNLFFKLFSFEEFQGFNFKCWYLSDA